MPHPDPQHPSAVDAIEFLCDDEDAILERFDRYDALVAAGGAGDERRRLADEICAVVAVHADIKREILLPAARQALRDQAAIDAAIESHDALDATVAGIRASDAADPRRDAGVRVLQELFVECMDEERARLFPLLRESTLDLTRLGADMAGRAERLLGKSGDENR